MERFVDFYELLGVEPYANPSDVDKAFRRMSLRFHPDKFPPDRFTPQQRAEAEAKFKQLSHARDILTDVDIETEGALRREYDFQYGRYADRKKGKEWIYTFHWDERAEEEAKRKAKAAPAKRKADAQRAGEEAEAKQRAARVARAAREAAEARKKQREADDRDAGRAAAEAAKQKWQARYWAKEAMKEEAQSIPSQQSYPKPTVPKPMTEEDWKPQQVEAHGYSDAVAEAMARKHSLFGDDGKAACEQEIRERRQREAEAKKIRQDQQVQTKSEKPARPAKRKRVARPGVPTRRSPRLAAKASLGTASGPDPPSQQEHHARLGNLTSTRSSARPFSRTVGSPGGATGEQEPTPPTSRKRRRETGMNESDPNKR